MILSPVLRRAPLVAVLFAFTLPASGGYPPMMVTLQPYQVLSPNGTYLFVVKPSHRYGSGPSSATLTNLETKEVAWKSELPFTFWRACVDNRGNVGGFGYSLGPMGSNSPGSDGGDFLVRIINAKGKTIYAETSHRVSGFPSIMSAPQPSAVSLKLDAESNLMVIMMNDRTLRSYDLHLGELQTAIQPSREKLPVKDCFLDQFHALPSSPLLLLEYPHFTTIDDQQIQGTIFALMDRSGELVWIHNHAWTRSKPWERYYTESNVLSVSPVAPQDPFSEKPSSTFDLYFEGNAANHRVTFCVSNSGEADHPVWNIAETKRTHWTIPPDHHVPKEIPRLQGEKLGEFRLLASGKEPFKFLGAAALGPNDQIYALDRERNAVHVFDRDGTFIHLCQSDPKHVLETNYGALLRVNNGGEVFVRLKEDYPSKHFLHFSPQGIPSPKLLSHIPHLKRADSITRRPDGHWLDLNHHTVVASDGSIALRDSTMGNSSGGFRTPFPLPPNHLPTESINLYHRDGDPIRTIDFTAGKAFDRIAYDGNHIAATRVIDQPPSPYCYVLKASGEPIGLITIEQLVGTKNPSPYPFIVKNGSEILIVDLTTAMVFRYAMPR